MFYTDGNKILPFFTIKAQNPNVLAKDGGDLSSLGWYLLQGTPQPSRDGYHYEMGFEGPDSDGGYRMTWQSKQIPLDAFKEQKLGSVAGQFEALFTNGFIFDGTEVELNAAVLSRLQLQDSGEYLLPNGKTAHVDALLAAAQTHAQTLGAAEAAAGRRITAAVSHDELEGLYMEFAAAFVPWDAAATYASGDEVFHEGLFYRALSDVQKGVAPDLVFSGDTGGWKPL